MDIFQPNGSAPANAATLLTLPRDEMERQHGTAASSSSFVLLQVPLNFTVDDFINTTTKSNDPPCTDHEYPNNDSLNAYFVAGNSNTTDTRHQQPHDGICCVVESKGCTFTVHRIETSNTLILVPPSSSSSPSPLLPLASMETTDDNNSHSMNTSDTNDHHSNNANRKRKSHGTTTTSELPLDQSLPLPPQSQRQLTRVLAAHVVQPANSATARGGGGGTSGSYFLELRKKLVRLSDLRRALIVLDPYNDNNYDHVRIGRTVFDLATSLQVSQNEIRQGLQCIGAYSLPSDSSSTTQRYCLLADNITNDCYDAIVTGLYTMSDCTDDYGGTNGIVNLDQITFVKNIAHHIQNTDDTKILHVESILLHCLQLLRVDPLLSNGKFILDVSKVAACIVRRLFMKRTAAYHEKELFTTWQSELPGVGSIYQVSRSMLRGVAICSGDRSMDDENDKDDDHTTGNTTASSEFYWHYLPVESMPMDAQKCFDSLFDIKDRYTMYELEPYLQHLLDTLPNISNASGPSSSSSMTELLLRYTKLTTNVSSDGKTQTFYERK